MDYQSLHREVRAIAISPLGVDRIFRHLYPIVVISAGTGLMLQLDNVQSYSALLFASASTMPLTVTLLFILTVLILTMSISMSSLRSQTFWSLAKA